MLIANKGGSPLSLVKKADRVVVLGLPENAFIYVRVDGEETYSLQGEGIFPLKIVNQKVQITRGGDRSPITVFAERG